MAKLLSGSSFHLLDWLTNRNHVQNMCRSRMLTRTHHFHCQTVRPSQLRHIIHKPQEVLLYWHQSTWRIFMKLAMMNDENWLNTCVPAWWFWQVFWLIMVETDLVESTSPRNTPWIKSVSMASGTVLKLVVPIGKPRHKCQCTGLYAGNQYCNTPWAT